MQVTAGNAPIELETARISDVRTAEQLRTLPLNDPGVWSYAGDHADAGHCAAAPTRSRAARTTSRIRDRRHDDERRRRRDAIGPLANYIESFKEVKIDSANNSAERRVSARSRSCRSRARTASRARSSTTTRARCSARGIRSRAPAAGVIHFPGLALGGPVVIPRIYNGHGRTFWFVSGETVNGSAASADLNPTVPIEPWRRGDFSALGTADPQPVHR